MVQEMSSGQAGSVPSLQFLWDVRVDDGYVIILGTLDPF